MSWGVGVAREGLRIVIVQTIWEFCHIKLVVYYSKVVKIHHP